MNKYTVVILNRFEDVIQPLLRSLEIYEQGFSNIVIVADGHDRDYGYKKVHAEGRFIFSKSANLGIKATDPDDVILMNDDVRLLQFNTFEELSKIAYSNKSIGMLSPLVHGGCGNIYMRADRTDLWKDNSKGIHYCNGLLGGDRVTFACVYLKREMLNIVGPLDEKFIGYGYDDADMCIRTVQMGWKIAITNQVKVQHGDGGSKFVRGSNWNQSFMRNRIGGSRRNLEYLMSKFPDLFTYRDRLKIEQTNGQTNSRPTI